jgi:hypothetical protein
MQKVWVVGGVALGLMMSLPVWAQQAPPETGKQLATALKAQQYTQIEYQRCRSDLLDLWLKGDAAEQRAKDLEEEVRKLTEELATLRGKADAKPSN